MKDNKKQKNTSKLRFPGFEGEWESRRLEEICEVKGGKRIPQGFVLQSKNNGFPYITVSDMKNGTISLKKIKYVPENVVDKIKNYTISSKDIFISVAGTLGLVGIIPKELEGANLTENADKLTNLKCDQEFLVHFLKGNSLKRLIKATKTSNAQPKLAIYALKEMKLNLPQKEEQRKIAGFLGEVGEWIQNLQEQKKNLESYKKGMMQKIFSQKIRFKDENENGFPDWEEKRLGEIASFRRGSFPQPYGLKKWYDDENGFPFVQVYDVNDNFRLKNKTKRRITDIAKKLSVFVEKGTIVLTIQGSIGRIALTQYDACIDRTLLIFQSFKVPMDKIFFIYIVFLLFEIEKSKAPGGTIKTITKERLTKFKLLIPKLEEQQKIAEFLSSIDEDIELKQQQITKAEQWKKGLMQGLFV